MHVYIWLRLCIYSENDPSYVINAQCLLCIAEIPNIIDVLLKKVTRERGRKYKIL